MVKKTFDPAVIPPVKVLTTMNSGHNLRKMMEAISCTSLVDHADRVVETLCDQNFWVEMEEEALRGEEAKEAERGGVFDKEAARLFVRKSLDFMRGVADLTTPTADFAQRASGARQAYCNAMRSAPDAPLNRDLVFGFLTPSVETSKNKMVLSLSFGDNRVYQTDFRAFVQKMIKEIEPVLIKTKVGGASLGIGKFLSRLAKVMQEHIMAGIQEAYGITLSEGGVKVFIDKQFIGIEKSCEKNYEKIKEDIEYCLGVKKAEENAYTVKEMSKVLRDGALWANGLMFGVMLPRQGDAAGVADFKGEMWEKTKSFLFYRDNSISSFDGDGGLAHTRKAKAMWAINKIIDCLSAFSLPLCAHFMETLLTEEDTLNPVGVNEAYYARRAQRWHTLYPDSASLLSQCCEVETKANGKKCKKFASVMTLSCRKVIPTKKPETCVTGFTGRIIITLDKNEKVCATSVIAQKYGYIPTSETVLLPLSEENSGSHFKAFPVAYSDIVVRLFDAKKKADCNEPETELSSWTKKDMRRHRLSYVDVTNVGEDGATADVIYYTAGLAFMNVLAPFFRPSLFVMEGNTKRRFFDFRKDCVFSETGKTGADKSPAKAFSHDIAKLPFFCRDKVIKIFAVKSSAAGSRPEGDRARYLKENFKDVPALFENAVTLDENGKPLDILLYLLDGNHALIVSIFPKDAKDTEEEDEEKDASFVHIGEGNTSVVRHEGCYYRKTRKEAIAFKCRIIDASDLCHAVIAFFHDRSEPHLTDLSRALKAICFDCDGHDSRGHNKVDFYTALHLLRDGLIDLAIGKSQDAEKANAVLLAMGQTKGRIASESFFKSHRSNNAYEKMQNKEYMACAQSLKSLVIKLAPLPVRIPRAMLPFVESGDIEISVTQVSHYIALKREKETRHDPRFVSTRTLSFREKVERHDSIHSDLSFFDLSERSIISFDKAKADNTLPNTSYYDPLRNRTFLTVTDRRHGAPVVYHAFYQEKGRLQNDESIVTASVTDGKDAALSVFVKNLKETNELAVRIFMKACLAYACLNSSLNHGVLLGQFGSLKDFITLAQKTCAASSSHQASFLKEHLQEHVTVVSQPIAGDEAFTSILIDGFLLVTAIKAKEHKNGQNGVDVDIECAAISESHGTFVSSMFFTVGVIAYVSGTIEPNPDHEPQIKRSKVDKGDKGHMTKSDKYPDKLLKQERNGKLFNLTEFATSMKEQGMPLYPLPFRFKSGINTTLPETEAGILVAMPMRSIVEGEGTLTQDIFVSSKNDETTSSGIAHRNLMETIVVFRKTPITHPDDSEDQRVMMEIADLMLNLHSGITTINKGTKHTTIFSYA